MENKDLIPFSVEKWESGEYELAFKETVHIQEIFEGQVYYRTCVDKDHPWNPTRTYHPENIKDLLLRKKTKKVWYPIFRQDCFGSKEDCDAAWHLNKDFIKSIQVEL